MKTGDKVRFLNDVGGGTIVGFPDKQTVSVRDESGFDIPVLRSEIVVIEEAAIEQTTVVTAKKDVEMSTHKVHRTETSTTTPSKNLREEGEKINLILAYIRKNEEKGGQQRFEAYLINDSNYYIQFVLSEQDAAGAFVRHADVIEPDTKLFLESFTDSEIAAHERLLLQAFCFKTECSFGVKPVLQIDIKTEGSKFFKYNTFKTNEFFREEALLIELVKDDIPLKSLKVDPQVLTNALLEKKNKEVSLPVKKQPARATKANINEPIEVDLHISELVDTTQGMSAKDMLDYQIKVFHDTMAQHLKTKGTKIVFIHGKGNGVLRNEIERLLRTMYKSCRYQDASFCEYGFGATLVTIA